MRSIMRPMRATRVSLRKEPSFDSQSPTSAYRIMLPHMLPGAPNHRPLPRPAAPVRASKGACEGEWLRRQAHYSICACLRFAKKHCSCSENAGITLPRFVYRHRETSDPHNEMQQIRCLLLKNRIHPLTSNDISARHAGCSASEVEASLRLNAIADRNDDVKIKKYFVRYRFPSLAAVKDSLTTDSLSDVIL